MVRIAGVLLGLLLAAPAPALAGETQVVEDDKKKKKKKPPAEKTVEMCRYDAEGHVRQVPVRESAIAWYLGVLWAHYPVRFYRDRDGDGVGDAAQWLLACEAPEGYVEEGGDCDDRDAEVHPYAQEVCGNEVDEDCDGEAAPCPTACPCFDEADLRALRLVSYAIDTLGEGHAEALGGSECAWSERPLMDRAATYADRTGPPLCVYRRAEGCRLAESRDETITLEEHYACFDLVEATRERPRLILDLAR